MILALSELHSDSLRTRLNYLNVRLWCPEEKKAIAFEQGQCNAKVSSLQALLNGFRYACKHVANRLNGERIRLEVVLVAAANKVKDEVSHFLYGTVFYMEDCVGKDSSHALGSVKERFSMMVKIFRGVEHNLHHTISGQSVLHQSLFYISLVISSRDVLLLP